jgi:hypothetical protein
VEITIAQIKCCIEGEWYSLELCSKEQEFYARINQQRIRPLLPVDTPGAGMEWFCILIKFYVPRSQTLDIR